MEIFFWLFLYSQADILDVVERKYKSEQQQAYDDLHPSTLTEMNGGKLITVDGSPHVSLDFKPGVGVGSIHNIPTYPTQMWEATGAFGLFLFLAFLWKRFRKFDGQILATMMICYAALRTTLGCRQLLLKSKSSLITNSCFGIM